MKRLMQNVVLLLNSGNIPTQILVFVNSITIYFYISMTWNIKNNLFDDDGTVKVGISDHRLLHGSIVFTVLYFDLAIHQPLKSLFSPMTVCPLKR